MDRFAVAQPDPMRCEKVLTYVRLAISDTIMSGNGKPQPAQGHLVHASFSVTRQRLTW